jgi:hypothetical protein
MIQSHEIITNPECKVSVGCKAHWLVNGSIVVNPLILFIFYCHRERAWVRLEIKCLEIIYIYIYIYIFESSSVFFLSKMETSSLGTPFSLVALKQMISWGHFHKHPQPIAELCRAGTSTWATMESSPSRRTRFGARVLLTYKLYKPH